jgi:serine/threonine protein kinase
LAALQTIRSKHVVQIFDVVRDAAGAVTAIVEEYLPGDDLTKCKRPATKDEFLRLIYPIAEGIADVHAHNRVHRDIKRQNMKYDGEGCLKLFDFGLARAAPDDASTIGFWGTPGYMAPELYVATKSGRVSFTTAVDTFAFGATSLAVAKGRVPDDLRETPPKLPCAEADFARLPLRLPADVSEILNRCLDRDASKRPAMAEVVRMLGAHLLFDQHRALLVSRGSTYVLDKDNRVAVLTVKDQGSLTITYDGLRFAISKITGDVAINNLPSHDDDELPGSCVIVLGAQALGGLRTMITVDVSHPEVVI